MTKFVRLPLGFIISLIMSFFVLSLSAQNSANALLQKSEEAFNAQRWKSAGTLYDLLLKDSVNYSPYMAKALLAHELAADSVSIKRATDLYLSNRTRMDLLLTDFSKLCIRLHHFDVFEESLNRLRGEMPEMRDTLLYGMIKYRMFLRDAPGAIRLAAKGLSEQPDNLTWMRWKAAAYQVAGESEKALTLYRKILAKNPNDVDALVYEGNYHYLQGKKKLNQLEIEFEKLSSTTRMQYVAYRRGVQEVLENEFAQAIVLLEKAHTLHPNTTLAQTLYEMYVLKSEVEKANKLKKKL